MLNNSFQLAPGGVDPARVPFRQTYTGARIPAVGLGTFGSDHVTAETIAAAVQDAIAHGYRHIDCASVYRNEHAIGPALQAAMKSGVKRSELWITSKLWNDKHAEQDVIPSCEKSLADLQLDYLDLYLVHWPFPNFHPPGCSVDSRSPDAKPYIHENFMKTWRQLEKLVDLGFGAPHRDLQHDHPEAQAAFARRPDQTGLQRNGTASALPATRTL
jgi:alcohol dehydrogenase (NADP+)